MNTEIKKAIEYSLNLSCSSAHAYHIAKLFKDYFKNDSNIRWAKLCEFSNIKIYQHKPLKFCLNILIYAIEHNILESNHVCKMNRDLPYIKKIQPNSKESSCNIFVKNYDEVIYLNIKKNGFTIKIWPNKKVFKELYLNYYNSTCNIDKGVSHFVDTIFFDSLKDINISSYKEIDSNVFWTQIKHVKQVCNNEKSLDKCLKNICKFYRWLIHRYSDYDFFYNSTSLSNELVLSSSLVIWIKRNAYFTTYSNTENLDDKDLIVFILKNMDIYSTLLKKNDYFVLNVQGVTSKLYRSLVIKYIQNTNKVSLLASTNPTIYIIDCLSFIENLKSKHDYPNPDFRKFNTAEAVLVKKYFNAKCTNLSLITFNGKITAIRRFFIWCQSNNYLSFDDTFFDYLFQYESPNNHKGNAIPDEDISKISDKFIELCKTNQEYMLYYAIFLILIETEFRISQVCNLKISMLQSTLKNDQFLLYSNTKTSNGRKVSQPICASTKHILEIVINQTQTLRNQVIASSYADHIFLKIAPNKSVHPIRRNTFLNVFQNICSQVGVARYNCSNLRDTHMTKAFEFILKNGKSNLEMGLLSKHSQIDTTKSHYIDMELTKMLESTYNLTLGDRDITKQLNILTEFPDGFDKKENEVENGCGCCKATQCATIGSLPCLVCNDFVTTIKHKPFFIKMIENIDTLLNNAKVKHEKEDLILIKTLYVNWLRELYIKEEEHNDFNN